MTDNSTPAVFRHAVAQDLPALVTMLAICAFALVAKAGTPQYLTALVPLSVVLLAANFWPRTTLNKADGSDNR